jgi:hypothetical protein
MFGTWNFNKSILETHSLACHFGVASAMFAVHTANEAPGKCCRKAGSTPMHRQPLAVAQRQMTEDEVTRLLGEIRLQHLTLIELFDLVALLRPAAERRRARRSAG